MTTKSDAIRTLLRERYPCGAVLQGDFARIALEFRCSRELVRRLAKASELRGGVAYSSLPRSCPGCSQPFTGGRAKKYCSKECARLWTGIAQRGRGRPIAWAYRAAQRTCPGCDREFTWSPESQVGHARRIAAGTIGADAAPYCSRGLRGPQEIRSTHRGRSLVLCRRLGSRAIQITDALVELGHR